MVKPTKDGSATLRSSAAKQKFLETNQIPKKAGRTKDESGGHLEFGGVPGAVVMMVSAPLTIILIYVTCNEASCSFLEPPDFEKYLTLSSYFNLKAYAGLLVYIVSLAILSVVPFGGKRITGLPTKQGKLTYLTNGLFCCAVLVLLGVILELCGVAASDFVVNHIFQLLIGSLLFAFCMSLFVFGRSFFVPKTHLNGDVVGTNPVYSFFMGRELNPRLFGVLDLKMYIFRLTIIGAVILDISFLHQSLASHAEDAAGASPTWNIHIHKTLLVLIALKSIYLLDGLFYEHTWITTFEVQYESLGYMSVVGYFFYPFMAAALTKFVYDHRIEMENWKLGLATCVFLLGYTLLRGSNNQKSEFRRNPKSPSVAHLKTIASKDGKKLIVSGFWGVVRHPNYVGEMLMLATFMSFVWTVPPVFPYVSSIFLLLHRTVRDNERCKLKYGQTWDEYCSRVKYVLIPKIY